MRQQGNRIGATGLGMAGATGGAAEEEIAADVEYCKIQQEGCKRTKPSTGWWLPKYVRVHSPFSPSAEYIHRIQ